MALITTFCQTAWAVSQALILFLLAHEGRYTDIGQFVLATSIFAPLNLLLGQNFRTRIAIDDYHAISLRVAFGVRSSTILFSGMVSYVSVYILFGGVESPLLLISLLMLRAIDLMSDVAIGYFQKTEKYTRIAISFLLRAFFTAFSYIVFVYLLELTVEISILLTSFIVLSVVLIFDTFPIVVNEEPRVTDPSPPQVDEEKEGARWLYFFPFFDSLNTNSFRYMMFFVLPPEKFGVFGLCQSLFMPIQLLTTAIGYRQLRSIRTSWREQTVGGPEISKIVAGGVAIGLLAFIVFSLAPSFLIELLFARGANEVRFLGALLFVGMLLWPACALNTQVLVATGKNRNYLFSTLIGIAIILPASIIAYVSGLLAPWVIVQLFSASLLVRILWVILSLKREKIS